MRETPAFSQYTLLEALRRRRGMSLESLAGVLGRSLASVQRYRLAPDEANFVHPPPAIGAKLKDWSGGFVHLGNCTELWTPEIDAEWLAAGLYEPRPADAVPEDVQ